MELTNRRKGKEVEKPTWLLMVGLFASLLLPGCSKIQKTKPDLGQPWDYFPIEAGSRWVYKIQIGQTEPLLCRTVRWPQGEMTISCLTRGRFRGYIENPNQKVFWLKLRSKGPALKQGPLQFPESAEIEIEQDDLGIYEDTNGLYWAITRSDGYIATEVAIYPPETPGAPSGPWGSWLRSDGYSMRIIFFGEKPGIAIGIGKESFDRLLFLGPEGERLHFRRIIEKSKEKEISPEESLLDKPFTEDMWFEKNKGLVYLEQKVEGKISMTWELIEFSEG